WRRSGPRSTSPISRCSRTVSNSRGTCPVTTTLIQLVDDLQAGRLRVVDLTQPLGPSTPVIGLPPMFAASPGVTIDVISRYDDRGPARYWNTIRMGEHTGTHFDAPVHWITGKDLPNNACDTIPVRQFIGPACVVAVTADVETSGTDAGQAGTSNPPFPSHATMHGAGKFGLASLCNLDQLPPTGAIVFAAPLKIVNGSGSPLRVIAIAPA